MIRRRKPLDVSEQNTVRVRELARRIERLEQASHGHCLTCGTMTPGYGMTDCGRDHDVRRDAG